MKTKRKSKPGWFLFTADHDPDHQSHSEFYEWVEEDFTNKDSLNLLWDDFFKDTHWPIGKITRIKKLPKEIRLQKIEECKRVIRNNVDMLMTLGLDGLDVKLIIQQTIKGK